MTNKNFLLTSKSPEMMKTFGIARAVAKTHARVMLLGESGVGKEVIAKFIHEQSPQAEKPFVPLNCAAIPKDLLESELFGHARGSFTSALTGKAGLLEEVGTGTLFLDEVGELSAELQAKLLRVLQDGDYRRVGENRLIRFNGRIISATNANMADKVRAGKFREDLLYRLSVVPITIPPLRERLEDLPELLDFLLKGMGSSCTLERKALKHLQRYHYPGNIRQLKNMLEYVQAMGVRETVIKCEIVQQAINAQAFFSVSHPSTGVVRFDSNIMGRLDQIEAGLQSGLKIEDIGRKAFEDLPSESARVRVSQWLQNKKTRALIKNHPKASSLWPKTLIWFDHYNIDL